MRALTVHALAILLVFGFANTFVLWREIGERFGEGVRDSVPWTVVGLIAAAIVWWGYRYRHKLAPDWRWIVAGAAVACVGLAVADPSFPAKRVHVPQYFLLTLVVWCAIPARMRTPSTIVLTLVSAAMYGVHDEFIQGFHPSRTYGVRDMIVNLCGATSGACVLVAMIGARPVACAADPAKGYVSARVSCAVAAGIAGVILLAWIATGYRHDLIPYWTVLPVLAGGFWIALCAESAAAPADRLALRAISVISALYFLYPLLTDVSRLDFA